MDIIKNLETVSIAVDHIGYWNMEIPSQADDEISKNIEYFRKIAKSEKDKIKNNVSEDIAWLLLSFSERMATLSLRTCDQNIFCNGMFALDIAYGKLDSREILIIMSLYFDVSVKNRLSFDEILKQKEPISETIQLFLNREEEDKKISAMGYIIENDKMNQPAYKRTW